MEFVCLMAGLFEHQLAGHADRGSPSLYVANRTQVRWHLQPVPSLGSEPGLEFASERGILPTRWPGETTGITRHATLRPLHFLRLQDPNWFLPFHCRSPLRGVAPLPGNATLLEHAKLPPLQQSDFPLFLFPPLFFKYFYYLDAVDVITDDCFSA